MSFLHSYSVEQNAFACTGDVSFSARENGVHWMTPVVPPESPQGTNVGADDTLPFREFCSFQF